MAGQYNNWEKWNTANCKVPLPFKKFKCFYPLQVLNVFLKTKQNKNKNQTLEAKI